MSDSLDVVDTIGKSYVSSTWQVERIVKYSKYSKRRRAVVARDERVCNCVGDCARVRSLDATIHVSVLILY